MQEGIVKSFKNKTTEAVYVENSNDLGEVERLVN